MFELGLVAFGVCSVACALAPNIELLIGARALQGAAGALVTPSSLAIIVAAFGPAERGAAIGSWTAWGGISAVVGPLAGGLIVDQVSWRWIFAVNVPLVLVTLPLIRSAVPRTTRSRSAGRLRRRGTVRARARWSRVRPRRAAALRLEQPGHLCSSHRRRRCFRIVPRLRAAGSRADVEARAVHAPQLRRRERRDARRSTRASGSSSSISSSSSSRLLVTRRSRVG